MEPVLPLQAYRKRRLETIPEIWDGLTHLQRASGMVTSGQQITRCVVAGSPDEPSLSSHSLIICGQA